MGSCNGVSCYHTYGPDHMPNDLSHYLGPQFAGEYLGQYVLSAPKAKMPLYHLVGALDPITEADIGQRINDGGPETLPEWIRYSGLSHIKIKLNGEDLKWDVDRVVTIDRVTAEVQGERGVSEWFYSTDFNEKCPNVEYLIAFSATARRAAAAGFRAHTVHRAADQTRLAGQPGERDA